MSGPGSNGDSYRCDACRHRKNRCEACREARATAARDRRAAKVADGICVHCTQAAEPGCTLCADCSAANNERSKRSHDKARRAAGAAVMPQRGKRHP